MVAAGQQLDPYTTPAGVPPPGVVPNLGPGAPSQQDAILGVCITFIILTTAFVAMRVYVALRITKIPALENWFCVIALVFSFAYMGILMHLSYASRHMWDVPLSWMFVNDEYWKLRLAQNLMCPVAFFFSRIPVFMLYRRIFSSVRWLRWACIGGIVAAFAIYMHTVPLVGALCYPEDGYNWRDMHTFERCSLGKPDAIAQGAGNIVLDLYALLIPLPVIWGLKLPMKKKIGLMVVFTTGSFALIASCVSLYYRIQLAYGDDTNWNEGAYDASSAIEINIAIICSCMPALASLMKAHSTQGSFFTSIRSLFRSQRSQRSESSGGISEKKEFKLHFKQSRQSDERSDESKLVDGSRGSSLA